MHETIYTCYARVDAPPTSDGVIVKRIVSEYCINKHWTGVQVQATSHHQGESVIVHCILLGSSLNARCVLPGTCIIEIVALIVVLMATKLL